MQKVAKTRIGRAVSWEALERWQLLLYVLALITGGGAGLLYTDGAAPLETLVWPTLAVLLYATFSQVRLSDSIEAFRHGRFFAASLLANFAVIPGVVWALAWLFPLDQAVRLGVFMVLLAPCTDWFVTFTHLAKGDTGLAVAVVPVQLAAQFLVLALFLCLVMGPEFNQVLAAGPFAQAFIGLIVVPFVLAMLTRRAAVRSAAARRSLDAMSRMPVPLLSLTLFLVAASQVSLVGDVAGALGWAVLVFVLYLAAAAPLARIITKVFSIDVRAGRTLAFNMGTRNSFVVLPLALALPAGWEAAVAAIVLQSIVELSGIVAYLWWVPRWLFPATTEGR